MGYIRQALEKGYLEHLGSACCTDNMFEILKRNDFWDVSRWLAGAYKSSGGHLGHQRTPFGSEMTK